MNFISSYYEYRLHYAHDKVSEMVLSGFGANNLNKKALQRIAGSILKTDFLTEFQKKRFIV